MIGASLARITSECTYTSLSEQLKEHARQRAREIAEGERAKERVTTRQAHTYIDSDICITIPAKKKGKQRNKNNFLELPESNFCHEEHLHISLLAMRKCSLFL